jgi:predicted Rossmann fold nucleotide-binding protein DprA/Smf involved in DNA uptake
MRIAIVGSARISNEGLDIARKIIESFFIAFRPDHIVSGGAKGVDTLAETMANDRGIPFTKFLPEKPTWKYYKKRNKLIAENCDILLAIRSAGSRTYGSGWTADYAETLHKPVTRFEVP